MAAIEFGNPEIPLSALWIHATGFNAHTYQSMLAPLGQRTRVAAVDMRGHGLTDLPADPKELKSWSTYRDDTIAFLEKHTTKPIILGGHSMGGCVALLVAGKRPDLVRGLVPVDPVILSPRIHFYAHALPFMTKVMSSGTGMARRAKRRRGVFDSREAAIENYAGKGAFSTWREPFLADYIEDGLRPIEAAEGVEAKDAGKFALSCAPKWEAATFSAQRNRPWQALEVVREKSIPILIMRSDKNSVISNQVASRLARKCQHLVIKQRPQTTHFLPMEAPYDVRDELTINISRLIDGFSAGDEGPTRRTLRAVLGQE